ncbi:MAG: hypothetical protein PHS96_09250 [Anaerolineales bacterium]|nr:hypothetical protein [Anaerolineales bacterium]
MKVIDVQLDQSKLLLLPEDERILYFSLGHATNEVNALAKLLYWVSNGLARNEAEQRGREALELLFIRLLAGKLYESWVLLKRKYFSTGLSKKYDSRLDDVAKEVFQKLRRYFSSGNACNKIRNRFAFHYSPDELAVTLPTMTDELHAYLQRDAAPNNLFAFPEALLAQALLTLLKSLGDYQSLDKLVDELFDVGVWFAQVTDALMFAIHDNSGLELRLKDPVVVQFEELPALKSVAISWFSDTSDAVNSQSGLA